MPTSPAATVTRPRMDVGFGAERSVAQWERRHALGEVPSRWPYGLDALSRTADVRAVALPEPGIFARGLLRARLGRRLQKDAVGLTWDENIALRMRALRPYARQVSGVIWVTDAVRRGRDASGIIRVLRRLDRLWVLSEAQIDPLLALVGSDGPDVGYVRFGIDHEFFQPRPPASRPTVVSVGGDRDRDVRTLFAALDIVHSARPHVRLVAQTPSATSPPPGVETIKHLPHRELRDLYASASVVAIATRENLHVSGMTVSLEAMATARPVAITRSPGMEDYLADGRTSLLSAQGDPAALAENVIGLLDDPHGAAAMGVVARKEIEQRFTSTEMAEDIAALAVG